MTTLLLALVGLGGSMKVRREAWVEEVIIHKMLIGEGKKEDPYRELLVVIKKDGLFIAEWDEWKERHEKHSPKEH